MDTFSLESKPTSNKKKYLYSVLSLFAILLASLLPVPNWEFSICLFYNFTGIPCPGCGMGRAIIHFFHFHFMESFYHHPFGIPMSIVMIYFALCLIFPKLEILTIKLKKIWDWLIGFTLVLLLTFFVFRVYFVVFYPNKLSPYFYNFQNSDGIK